MIRVFFYRSISAASILADASYDLEMLPSKGYFSAKQGFQDQKTPCFIGSVFVMSELIWDPSVLVQVEPEGLICSSSYEIVFGKRPLGSIWHPTFWPRT